VRRVGRRLLVGAAAVLIMGNLSILGASLAARAEQPPPDRDLPGVDNFRVVDERVLRGDAPTVEGYRSLAALGVTTIVDLRAERDLHVPDGLLTELGIERVALPIRDGQTPTAEQVRRFVATVEASGGLVFLHCGAGVGRTGAMTAAYLVTTGQRSGRGALLANLAVGPPSLEQILYAATLDLGGAPHQPPDAIKVVSRFLDGPRRLWSRYGL
jgi:protein-tyrosine phosphatase